MSARDLVPLLTSVGTLAMMWLAGDGDRRAWIVGLLNQALWLLLIILFGTWGLLPLTLSLVVVNVRNLRRWTSNEEAPDAR